MDSPKSSSPPPDDTAAGPPESGTKPCPYCGETLKAAAVVCRFCRRDLFAPNAPPIILSPNDWEIARPASMVSDFVRMESVKIPVPLPAWTVMCLGLTSLIGILCVNLARLPDPPKLLQQTPPPVAIAPITATPVAIAPVASPTPKPTLETAPSKAASQLEPSLPSVPPSQPVPDLSVAEKAQEKAVANSILVTSQVLASTYLDTPSAADDKFTNHSVNVSGPVIASGKNENGAPFVVLKGIDNVSVRCIFAKSIKEVPPIEAGGIMRVYGTCDGKFIDVRVSECTPG